VGIHARRAKLARAFSFVEVFASYRDQFCLVLLDDVHFPGDVENHPFGGDDEV